ncbi:hypothetical protein [Herbiconiux solani]|uniref:hypothetical protein n=1 Tax=Herbiconiux solani TaxID=661329 RepID=UPI0008267046|nr:hypothetical protein [Herbiconiux solani]
MSDLLTADDRRDLVAIARALYPHAGLGDGPYERAVDALIAQAARQPAVLHALTDGLAGVREATSIPDADEGTLQALLAEREQTPFFRTTRAVIAWELYDDEETWEYIGFPGASFEKGGYLSRGFDDLAWLPEPRIEESPLPMTEVGPLAARRQEEVA